MGILLSTLSSIYIATGYIGLLSVRMRPQYYLFLFIYAFSLNYWFGISFGQWLTFLLILGNSLIVYWGCGCNLLNLSFGLAGHLILILIDHAYTLPLSIIGKSIPYLREHCVTVTLIPIFTTFIVLRLIRRHFILPRLPILYACPKKLLRFFLAELYVGLSLMAANFIYGESVSYPTEVLSFNGMLIAIFVLSTILIFYSMYDILKKNHELSLQQAQSDIMQDYAHRMESLYEDIRVFRHDYRNILSTMQQYIDNGNTETLKKYFYGTILNNVPVLSDDGFYLGRLRQIGDGALKSLLYTKIVAVLNQKINFNLEIAEPVPTLPVDCLTLCRILGILLDNAMEAAMESPEKGLRIAIVSTDMAVLFAISNSTPPLPVPVSSLMKRGYSTKEGHDGIGLATVAEILDTVPFANLSTKYEDGVFCQTLEVRKQPLKKSGK